MASFGVWDSLFGTLGCHPFRSPFERVFRTPNPEPRTPSLFGLHRLQGTFQLMERLAETCPISRLEQLH